jgi:hypothetical protein
MGLKYETINDVNFSSPPYRRAEMKFGDERRGVWGEYGKSERRWSRSQISPSLAPLDRC